MLRKLITFLFVTALLLKNWGCETARIVGYFSYPSYSHQIVYQKIWLELARRGHEVTVFTPNPTKVKLPNLIEIDLSNSYDVLNDNHELISDYDDHNDVVEDTIRLIGLFKLVLEKQLENPDAKKLFHEDNTGKYDLFIVEYLNPVVFALKDKLQVPMVGVLTLEPTLTYNDYVRNPMHPVANPDPFLPFYKNLTFWQRLRSYIHSFYFRINLTLRVGLPMKKYMTENFNVSKSTLALGSEVSLLFVNTPILSNLGPTTPQMIPFSGLHLKKENDTSELSKELEDLLDNSNEGVIYFSLGTNIKSDYLSDKKKTQILNAFSKLPFTVLWKFENETILHKPTNVYIHKWFPQQDVLAHPNVKLFITQCGLQSLEESIYYAVPLIAMPFYVDQFFNAKKVSYHKIGVEVDYKSLQSENFKSAIEEVIKNPSYKQNIMKISQVSREKPMDDLEKIIWYIEYTIRHKGAEYLKTSAMDVPLYQYLHLDIYAFLIISTTLSYYLMKKILRKLYRIIIKGWKRKDKSE